MQRLQRINKAVRKVNIKTGYVGCLKENYRKFPE